MTSFLGLGGSSFIFYVFFVEERDAVLEFSLDVLGIE